MKSVTYFQSVHLGVVFLFARNLKAADLESGGLCRREKEGMFGSLKEDAGDEKDAKRLSRRRV